jgi:hypothetical protein
MLGSFDKGVPEHNIIDFQTMDSHRLRTHRPTKGCQPLVERRALRVTVLAGEVRHAKDVTSRSNDIVKIIHALSQMQRLVLI